MNFTVIYFNKRFYLLHEYQMEDDSTLKMLKLVRIIFWVVANKFFYKDGRNGRKVFALYGLDVFLSNSLN